MKKILLFLLGGVSLLVAQPSLNINKISSALELEILEHPDNMLVVSLLLADRADMLALDAEIRRKKGTLADRSYLTITTLKAKAAETQGPLLAFLEGHRLVDQSFIRPFWINNVVFVRVHPDILPALSQRADLEWIDKDYQLESTAYERVATAPSMIPGGREPGIDVIRAHLMWQLGYTGKDRVAMSYDEGVDVSHPALAGRWRGNVVPASWSWYDFDDTTNTTPDFCDPHGSHTVGTIVGMDPMTSDTIGVAPEGYWIGSSWCSQGGQAQTTAAFQWAMDPDGDPTTSIDMPDAINNSWGIIGGLANECTSYFVGLSQALETAGIASIWAAGNLGPGTSTIGSPQNINFDTVDVFSVGNLNGNNPFYFINNGSSRGPSTCGGEGTLLIKPEVSAPGTLVRSAVLNGNYDFYTGTSMAAPHVAGAILLLREAFPNMPSRDLKMALFSTARDLGWRGEDNDYGMGLIDVFTAYLELVADGNVPNTGTPPALELAVRSIIAPVDSALCENGVTPTVRLKNYGTDTITSFSMGAFYSNSIADTFTWAGSWAPGTELDFELLYQPLTPATYDFSAVVYEINGTQDFFDGNNFGTLRFVLLNEPVINAISDTVCEGSDAVLVSQTANPWEIQWYTEPNGGFPINAGNQFTLPALANDTLIYIGSGLSGVLGLADTSQTNGSFYTATDGELYFTLDQAARLESVDLVAETPGIRFIQILKDLQANTVLVSSSAAVLDTGKQTIAVTVELEPGNYFIKLSGVGGAFHQSQGISYPLEIPGVGRITKAEPIPDAYYYFYNMRFLAENDCPRKPVSITTQPVEAVAAFTLDNASPELPDNATIQFTDGSSNATSWFWDFGDSTTSTDPSPQHAYTQPGTYGISLTVTDANGCTNTFVDSVMVTGFPTGLQADLALSFSAFPNPGVRQVFVEMERPAGVEIEVWNVAGKRMLTQTMDATGKMTLNMGMVPDGVYLIVARDGARQFTQKWVKQSD